MISVVVACVYGTRKNSQNQIELIIYQTTKTDEQKCQKMDKKSIPLMNEQFPLLPELIFRIHYYYPTNL